VDWFAERLTLNGLADYLTVEEESLYNKLKEQAKEKDKLEKEKCWIAALEYGLKVLKTDENVNSKEAFEQYYNETYGK